MNPAPAMPYSDPGQHLSDLLVLVRLFLQRHLVLYTDRYLDSKGENSNRFVSRREVDSLLSMEAPPPEISTQAATVEETMAVLRAHVTARLEASADAGFRFPTEDLRAAFNLTEVQVDCVVALAAPEIDHAFHRAYAHAWSDLSRRHMDLGFLMDLVAGNGPRREEVWDALSPGSPLLRWGFVEVGLLPEQPPNVRFSERPIKAADRIVNWLRGRRTADPTVLGTLAEVLPPLASAEGFAFPAATTTAAIEAFRYLEKAPSRPAGMCLVGAPGVGRKTLVRTVLAGQGRPLLVLQVTRVPTEDPVRRRCLRDLVAEALLLDAVLYLDGIEFLNPAEPGHPVLADLHDLLTAERATVVIGTGVRIDRILHAMGDFMAIEVPFPETAEQERLWDTGLKAATRIPLDFRPKDLAGRYSVSPGVIQSCCADVSRWSQTAGRKARKVPPIVVVESIRRKLEHRLSSLALPIQKGESWDDLVLPQRTVDLLHEIVSFFRHRHRILRDFGLGNKLLKSPGIPCLFAGPPGTGKTMAAGIIGKEIGREVFQVDLSRVVDKYIGETEKNLSRIFEEGGRAQAVLLFDEADSLFAKRTEVKSSVDRYANLEVNFLLQRVESYEGVTVLTSNFATSIDDAFKRRLRFWVDFPFPEVEERIKLWTVLMPAEVPIAGPLDFEELAERYVVSGGHIRNIIIRAATLAAESDRAVDMDMLHRAGDMEYRVMGKLVREDREEGTEPPPKWSA